MKVSTWLNSKEVLARVKKASIERNYQCALLVEAEAKQSMKHGGVIANETTGVIRGIPSTPPNPPNVQTGNLRSSIQSAKTPIGTAVVGPTYQGWYGRVHEFGSRMHPKRPFMRPALMRCKEKFAKLFKGLKLGGTAGE